ncbi:hypothetical protein CsatB_023116 [Cannabis sativa]
MAMVDAKIHPYHQQWPHAAPSPPPTSIGTTPSPILVEIPNQSVTDEVRRTKIYLHNRKYQMIRGRRCLNSMLARDDIESLAYTLVFLIKGRLPWQGYQVSRCFTKRA